MARRNAGHPIRYRCAKERAALDGSARRWHSVGSITQFADGGEPWARRHGFPLVVVPGRRDYWWVKWVDRIELQQTPAWSQPPFPLN
jgi:hypothetical protein